jgi:hypothetical protein
MRSILGDTPGSTGVQDWGAPLFCPPPTKYHLLDLTPSKTAAWEIDPANLFDDSHLNSEFVKAARAALDEARQAGMRPRPSEVYRSPDRSAALAINYKKNKGHRAAGSWSSVHNYGLAMDAYAHDANGSRIDSNWKGGKWFKEFRKFERIMLKHGFVSGESFNDAGHFEYHPKWRGGAGKSLLHAVHQWAIDAADEAAPAQNGPEPDYDQWIPYFWCAAGAGGKMPPPGFLKDNPIPTK